MFDFDHDGDFDLEDLIEADIQYGLFEEDDKEVNRQIKKNIQKKAKSSTYSNTYSASNVQDKKVDTFNPKFVFIIFTV